MRCAMDKLNIQRISAYNPYWFSIRYTGSEQSFKAMGSVLRSYGRHGAYWRQGECNGRGAWIVRADILKKYADRFHNFESRANIALMTAERKNRDA